MEIFKILDRFEILNSNNKKLELLRRCYNDKDIYSILTLLDKKELAKAIVSKSSHSIFRIIDNKRCVGDIEDLRKAVLEDNIHSLFRLLPGNDDLRKAVCEDNVFSVFRLVGEDDLKKLIFDDNIWSLFKILTRYTDSYFVKSLKDLITNDIDFDEDCLSQGQIKSKLWLVNTLEEINVDLGVVFLCAGWYATLATMLFESKTNVERIVSFDIDPGVWKIAETFNKKWVLDDWRFKACTQDIHEIMFDEHIYDVNKSDGTTETLWTIPDTIINTSTEHLEDFDDWYGKILPKQLVILQNNNYFEVPEHVNCFSTLKQFSKSVPMSTVLYEGELELEKYTRFMKIGYK